MVWNIYLIVDDMPVRHDMVRAKVEPKPKEFLDAYSYKEAISILQLRGDITHVFLDYDLSLVGPTGLDVARYMIKNNVRIPVTVISQNPPGSEAIMTELAMAGFMVSRQPLFI